jgi:hypothetical protein
MLFLFVSFLPFLCRGVSISFDHVTVNQGGSVEGLQRQAVPAVAGEVLRQWGHCAVVEDGAEGSGVSILVGGGMAVQDESGAVDEATAADECFFARLVLDVKPTTGSAPAVAVTMDDSALLEAVDCVAAVHRVCVPLGRQRSFLGWGLLDNPVGHVVPVSDLNEFDTAGTPEAPPRGWSPFVFSSVESPRPQPRGLVAASGNGGGNNVVVFGGRGAGGPCRETYALPGGVCHSRGFVLNTTALVESDKGSIMDVTAYEMGTNPPPLEDGVSWTYDGGVYMYGGWDGVSHHNTVLWRFDTSLRSWSVVGTQGESPGRLLGASALVVAGTGIAKPFVVIFGGFRVELTDTTKLPLFVDGMAAQLAAATHTVSQDVYLFHLDSGEWELFGEVAGRPPQALYPAVVGTHVGNEYVALIHGGIDLDDSTTDQLAVTDELTVLRVSLCAPGYTGDKCDVKIDCSARHECNGDHGYCIGAQLCRCVPGFHGESCETFDCAGLNECSGHGTCTGPNTCVCDDGWYQTSCHLSGSPGDPLIPPPTTMVGPADDSGASEGSAGTGSSSKTLAVTLVLVALCLCAVVLCFRFSSSSQTGRLSKPPGGAGPKQLFGRSRRSRAVGALATVRQKMRKARGKRTVEKV